MIKQITIDKIQDSAKIEDVVGDFVTLKKRGRLYECCCPFHNENTPSFKVNPVKNTWHCYGACGEGGDPISFVMKQENWSYRDALLYLAKKYSIEVEEETDRKAMEERKAKEGLYIVANAAQEFYAKNLSECKDAYDYAVSRWGEDYVKEEGIGYAPDSWDALSTHLKNNGYSLDAAVQVGVLKKREKDGGFFDFFRDRLTIPIRDRYHRVISFTARVIPSHQKPIRPGERPESKYINTSTTPIFEKSRVIFGIENALHQAALDERFYLMEGAPDAIRMQSIGVANAIASLGCAWSEDHFKQIKKYASQVCFLPDADVQKDDSQFPPGTKAVLANGEIALKCGFTVYVRPIPLSDNGEKQDPDSYITSKEVFDRMEEQDFIVWAAHQHFALASDDQHCKSYAVKEVARLVSYTDAVNREMYYEKLAKIDGKIKLWKTAVAEAMEKMREKDKKKNTIDREDYEKYKFWVNRNSYFSYGKQGDVFQWSNFMLVPLFHIKDPVNSKRLFIIRNEFDYEEMIELKTDDMVSLNTFRKRVEALGNFIWFAKEEQLQCLKRYVFQKVDTAMEIVQLGWHKRGFFAFGNGVYYNGRWHETDIYGVVRLGEMGNYYLPSNSAIYKDEDDLYQWERKFIYKGENTTRLDEYVGALVDVFGNNGKVGFCFMLATLFRDVVFGRTKHFPMLNLFGPKGSGKSQLGHALMAFFYLELEAPNIENTTISAMGEAIGQCSNALVHFDEFKNDINNKKREFFKALWDGTGRTKMDMDRGKQKMTTRVQSGIIISGQEMATADIALFSRMIFLTFSKAEFSTEEQRRFDALITLEQQGLSHLTMDILRHREKFVAGFSEAYKEAKKDIEDKLRDEKVETRTLQNWIIPLASLRALGYSIILPFDYNDMLKVCVDGILLQNRYVIENNEVSGFWESLRAMRAAGSINMDGDYRIDVRTTLSGLRDKTTRTFQRPTQILYLRISSVLAEYNRFVVQTHGDTIAKASFKYYLEMSEGFLGVKNSCRFKQMRNGYPVIETRNGRSYDVSSVDIAYCFDYARIKERYDLNLDNVSGDIEEEVQDPAEPPEPDPQKTLDFGDEDDDGY